MRKQVSMPTPTRWRGCPRGHGTQPQNRYSGATNEKSPRRRSPGAGIVAVNHAMNRLTAGYFPVVVLLGPIVSLPAPTASVLVESDLPESAAGVLGSFSSD